MTQIYSKTRGSTTSALSAVHLSAHNIAVYAMGLPALEMYYVSMSADLNITIKYDDRIDSYESFFDHDWVKRF
jgi:hypothetical protein